MAKVSAECLHADVGPRSDAIVIVMQPFSEQIFFVVQLALISSVVQKRS